MNIFWLKKILTPLLYPTTLYFVALCVAFALSRRSRTKILARRLFLISSLLLIICAYGFPGNMLLRHLESQNPPLVALPENLIKSPVVVLGGGIKEFDLWPSTSQLGNTSLIRLMEGLRLQRQTGGVLILSGGKPYGHTSEAEMMHRVTYELGLPMEQIRIEDRSRDTKDQARFLKNTLGETPFILVTSAWHMPRSLALFRGQGLDPTPAPTDHRINPENIWRPTRIYPSSGNLVNLKMALREIAGLFWAKFRGQT